MFAARQVHQVQARHVAGLAVGLAIQAQAQAVAGLQTRVQRHADAEGAVVGTQGFVGGDVGEREHLVEGRTVGLVGPVVGRSRRCLGAHGIGRRQLHPFAGGAVRGLVGEHRVAVGVYVPVDLCGGWQRYGEQQAADDDEAHGGGLRKLMPSLAPGWRAGKSGIVR
ncbi:hypothetical protein D9M68_744890 [compost metagenome]